MNQVTLKHDGKTRNATVERIGETLWIKIEGRVYNYKPERVNRQAGAVLGAESGVLLAPMPGKITQVFKKPGENVVMSDVILVMEAMKMEYSVSAPKDGVLEELTVKVGQIVGHGEALGHVKGKKE